MAELSVTAGLTHVAPVLRVADLDRSLSYYRDQLGFEVEFTYEGFYAGVLRDRCRIHLKRSDPVARDETALGAAEHVDACFGVQDAAALASGFASTGAVFAVPLRTMPYGSSPSSSRPRGEPPAGAPR